MRWDKQQVGLSLFACYLRPACSCPAGAFPCLCHFGQLASCLHPRWISETGSYVLYVWLCGCQVAGLLATITKSMLLSTQRCSWGFKTSCQMGLVNRIGHTLNIANIHVPNHVCLASAIGSAGCGSSINSTSAAAGSSMQDARCSLGLWCGKAGTEDR